ncbi:hypothetical protein [Lactovum odontotermitis]
MGRIGILLLELAVTGLIVFAGLSSKQFLFINGPRAAAITLGTIGFAMCMLMPTIGKFIRNAPAHPLTILGYIFGIIALITAAAQIFNWHLPLVGSSSRNALLVIAACIVIKSIIACFAKIVMK